MQITELQPKPQTLNFNGHEFTMILINGEPYFNANEVANTLEFANPRVAAANHVDSDDVALVDTLTKGGVQKQKFINESGLYALIFASKKPSAKDFKKWVTKEVIPSIRKTGSYSIQPQISLPNFTDPAEAAIAWANEYKAKQALAIELKAAEPKINHYDKVVERKNLLNATQVGEKLDGMNKLSQACNFCNNTSEHCCTESDKNYEARAHIIDAQDEHHHDEADAHVFMLNGLLVAKDVPMPKAGV